MGTNKEREERKSEREWEQIKKLSLIKMNKLKIMNSYGIVIK